MAPSTLRSSSWNIRCGVRRYFRNSLRALEALLFDDGMIVTNKNN